MTWEMISVQWGLNTWGALLHADVTIGQSRWVETALDNDAANRRAGRLILGGEEQMALSRAERSVFVITLKSL